MFEGALLVSGRDVSVGRSGALTQEGKGHRGGARRSRAVNARWRVSTFPECRLCGPHGWSLVQKPEQWHQMRRTQSLSECLLGER